MRVLSVNSYLLWAFSFVFACVTEPCAWAGNIDPVNKYSWAENAGWVNFAPTNSGVTVHFSGTNGYLTGYAWGENIGWIKLGDNTGGPYNNDSATDWGVNLDGAGNLSGYAWGESVGWIKFNSAYNQVTIDLATGSFSGDAWGETIGWIRFKGVAPSYNVRTTAFDSRTATGMPVIVAGFVVGVTLGDGGAGYTNAPRVRIFGECGSGAGVVATVSNGVVTGIAVTNAGSGYTCTTFVVISPPFIPQPVAESLSPMTLLTFTNLSIGTNYQLQLLRSTVWGNVGSAFAASNTTHSQYVAGIVLPSSYRLAIPPVPQQAYGTAQIVGGFVVGVTVTNGGSGYVTNPAVQFIGGGGTNAAAVSSLIGGSVSSITVTNAGIGYTSAPSVRIDSPPAEAVQPNGLPVMQVRFGDLSPYDNYQVEYVQNLNDGWGAYGSLIVPTAISNTIYLPAPGTQGFYRARYMP